MKNYKGVENDIYRLSENVKIKRNNVENVQCMKEGILYEKNYINSSSS